MTLINADELTEKLSNWYWEHDKQELAKDPCVIDAMIDLFIRTCQLCTVITPDNLNRDKGSWIEQSNIVTPGGDPYYVCSNCKGGGHINGVEHQEHWEYCPDCGSHNGSEFN